LLVGFLDGDPDRPIAMQKYYNSDNVPPYALPANKTQGALESSSSPGGAALNSIRAQDSSGGMQLAFNAARDLSVTAGRLLKEHVTENAKSHIAGPLETTVGTNETVH